MSFDVLALRHSGWFCTDAYLRSLLSSGLLYAFNLNVDRFMTMVMKVFDLIVLDTASFSAIRLVEIGLFCVLHL